MPKKVLVGFVTAAMMLTAAGSYRFTISRDATVGGKQLTAGDYKVEMKRDTAVLKHDRQAVEVPARVQTDPNKFASTTVRFVSGNEIQEIGFGGTHTKIVFAAPAESHPAAAQ
jgi:hypothetical protein